MARRRGGARGRRRRRRANHLRHNHHHFQHNQFQHHNRNRGMTRVNITTHSRQTGVFGQQPTTSVIYASNAGMAPAQRKKASILIVFAFVLLVSGVVTIVINVGGTTPIVGGIMIAIAFLFFVTAFTLFKRAAALDRANLSPGSRTPQAAVTITTHLPSTNQYTSFIQPAAPPNVQVESQPPQTLPQYTTAAPPYGQFEEYSKPAQSPITPYPPSQIPLPPYPTMPQTNPMPTSGQPTMNPQDTVIQMPQPGDPNPNEPPPPSYESVLQNP